MTELVGGRPAQAVLFDRASAYLTRLIENPNALPEQFRQPSGKGSRPNHGSYALHLDASILTDPFDFNSAQEGFTPIDQLVPKYVNSDNYGYSIHMVHKDWAKDHGDEIVRYTRAYLGAVRWIYEPANKDALFTIAGPKMNLDQAGFDRLYKKDIQDGQFWSRDGEVTEKGTQGVLNSLVELGVLKTPTPPPSKYFDSSWWRQATATMKPAAAGSERGPALGDAG